MRFTKFLAATMAAMTIVSCAEQVEDFGANVQPGDAVLSFKVGTNGGTTYATSTEESEVKTLIAYLKYTNGTGGDSFKEIAGTTAGLTTTLPDGSYTPGPAELYFVANMPAVAGVTSETELLAKVDNKTIYTNVNGTLTLDPTGMTATRKVSIDLQPGQVMSGTPDGGIAFTNGAVTLKRLAARVYAESGTGTAGDIAGYTVDFVGVSAQANLFDYQGAGTGTAPAQYKIAGTGAGQYGGKEAVGYVYPSTNNVTVTVTNDKGVAKEVNFAPKANQNYKLLITPAKEGTTLKFTVSIAVYDETEPELDVNFGATTLAVPGTAVVPAGFSVGGNGELEISDVAGTASAGVKILYADLFKGMPEANLQSRSLVSVRSLTSEYKISSDGMFAVGDLVPEGLEFIALRNYGADKTYTATFEAWDGSDESTVKNYSIKLVVKGMNLPENFTTKIGDVEFMSVGYQGSLEVTNTLVNEINALQGETFADKTANYLVGKTMDEARVIAGMAVKGSELTNIRETICPKGFAMPTRSELNPIFGNQIPAFGGAFKPINSGSNDLGGGFTLSYFNAANYPYYILSDGKNKIAFQDKANIAVSDLVGGATKSPGRVVFWIGQLQYTQSNLNAADTYVRCVKKAEPLLTTTN